MSKQGHVGFASPAMRAAGIPIHEMPDMPIARNLGSDLDPWDKGILVNLVMMELKLTQLRSGKAGKIPSNELLLEHVRAVLNRFRMNYSRPLMAELVQRVAKEIHGG